MEMIMAGATQDHGFWSHYFGGSCCSCASHRDSEIDDESLNSVFCSELVAHAYMETGIMKREQKAYMYLPKDFSSDPHNNVQDVINTEAGYELYGQEVMILRDFPSHKFYKFMPEGTYEQEDEASQQREANYLTFTQNQSTHHAGPTRVTV